jgi:hypothetical protein
MKTLFCPLVVVCLLSGLPLIENFRQVQYATYIYNSDKQHSKNILSKSDVFALIKKSV